MEKKETDDTEKLRKKKQNGAVPKRKVECENRAMDECWASPFAILHPPNHQRVF